MTAPCTASAASVAVALARDGAEAGLSYLDDRDAAEQVDDSIRSVPAGTRSPGV